MSKKLKKSNDRSDRKPRRETRSSPPKEEAYNYEEYKRTAVSKRPRNSGGRGSKFSDGPSRGSKFDGPRRGSKFSDGPRRGSSFSGRPSRGKFNDGPSRGSNFSGGPRRGSSNRANYGERRQERFDVVCDKCGDDCQVPFKPTSSKPVFCDKCYSKGGSSSVDLSAVNNRLDKIEEKVDKVLALLNIS